MWRLPDGSHIRLWLCHLYLPQTRSSGTVWSQPNCSAFKHLQKENRNLHVHALANYLKVRSLGHLNIVMLRNSVATTDFRQSMLSRLSLFISYTLCLFILSLSRRLIKQPQINFRPVANITHLYTHCFVPLAVRLQVQPRRISHRS